MDSDRLGPVEAPLQRARLHVRGGRRRLSQGKISAGIVTLYDAMAYGMEWYIADPGRRARLSVGQGEDLSVERVLYSVLVRSGILDGSFDYEAYEGVLERALREDMPGYDYRELLRGIEQVLTQLGVMPFDESALPPEDPETF